MAEFEDKLNSILSNPDAMSQIMSFAQSLGSSPEANAASDYEASDPKASDAAEATTGEAGSSHENCKVLSRGPVSPFSLERR